MAFANNKLVFLSITGLLIGMLFNPTAIFQSFSMVVNTVLETFHLAPTLDQELSQARYVPSSSPAVQYFEDIVKQGEPYMAAQGPSWVTENVYIALVDSQGNILDDYQVHIVNGKVVCAGRTVKTGGSADCGKPTVWIKADEYAVERVYKTEGIKGRAEVVKDLFLSGHIDVYPKTKAFDYLDKIGPILGI